MDKIDKEIEAKKEFTAKCVIFVQKMLLISI